MASPATRAKSPCSTHPEGWGRSLGRASQCGSAQVGQGRGLGLGGHGWRRPGKVSPTGLPGECLTSWELSRSASSTPLGGRGASESSESFSSSSSWIGDDGDLRVLGTKGRESGDWRAAGQGMLASKATVAGRCPTQMPTG